MELDEVQFNVRYELQKAFSIIGQIASQKNLLFEKKIDDQIPEEIFGDPTRYRQIILNLLSNAVKFTDEGKVSLEVRCTAKTDSWIELTTIIEDTGHGIPSEKIPLLFEPYVQVKSKKGKKEGSGLGLVISREFVKLMGGEIRVESKIGLGSKFIFTAKIKLGPDSVIERNTFRETLTIPEIVTEEIVPGEEVRANQPLKKKILLVEDNPISQNLELKILREVGYDVDAVSTGNQAIESIKSGVFDLVLMDIEMTDIDGITATKRIRELSTKESRIPIIAVTAHSSMKDREKCLAAGMDDYIAKPINIHFLKLTIDQWLKTSFKD